MQIKFLKFLHIFSLKMTKFMIRLSSVMCPNLRFHYIHIITVESFQECFMRSLNLICPDLSHVKFNIPVIMTELSVAVTFISFLS
jgi:hypothetical protein